eukprot:3088052-Rhodomonas_salina.1
MLILDGWDRQDFILWVELQKQKDVLVPLARKLAARTGETVLVKVKSHMGVALNEEADVEANKGLLSNKYQPLPRPLVLQLLTRVDSEGVPIADFNCKVRTGLVQLGLDNLRSKGCLNTESFLTEGRGQQ